MDAYDYIRAAGMFFWPTSDGEDDAERPLHEMIADPSQDPLSRLIEDEERWLRLNAITKRR